MVGVLVMAADKDQVFASGAAARAPVAAGLMAAWQVAKREQRSLFTVEAGGEGYSVVAVCSPVGSVLVVFERGASDVLFDFAATVDCADAILRHLLTNPYEALTVVDREGILRFISPIHERFFGLGHGDAIGRYVTEVIENTRLHEVVRSGKAEIGQMQHMRGATRIVSRMPVFDSQGDVVAAIGQVMFKGPDQLQQLNVEVAQLKRELSHYQQALSMRVSQDHGLDRIIGQSKAIRRLKEQVARIAPLDVPVLLIGESGTGKELIAHAIHLLSKRRVQSMVTVNAAAIPASLVESEMFGYEPGAFTGAERKGRRGKFEQAHQGTLFFDEIGDMPLEIQVKLLRVLQDGSFERVGGDKPRVSDFRLVCASNRDFETMISAGEFRLDLFYRISVVSLHLPPLRERLEDIELLANQALYDFSVRHTTRQKKLAPDVVFFLQRQSWPGNVRQLIHAVETAAIFADTDLITIDDFETIIHWHESENSLTLRTGEPTVPMAATPWGIRNTLNQVEEQMIREALRRFNGNKKRAAQELGISRSYLYKKLAIMSL